MLVEEYQEFEYTRAGIAWKQEGRSGREGRSNGVDEGCISVFLSTGEDSSALGVRDEQVGSDE